MGSGFWYLIASVLFWGVSYISIKIVLAELEPVEMISGRLILASLALGAVLLFRRTDPFRISNWLGILAMSAVIFLHLWVMATGMQETTASNTAWILTTAPFFVALLSWMYLKEKLNASQWIGLLVACIGVVALVYNGNPANLAWSNSRGDIIVLGSCLTWGVYTVGMRRLSQKVDPLVATFWMCLIASCVWVPHTLYHTGYQKYLDLSPNAAGHLIFLGIFCLALAFWFWSEGLKRQPAAEVGVYLYVEPLITVVAAWWLIDEGITLWLIIGAILITLGVYISERYNRKSFSAEAEK
ncbi:MAG: DMT family transporter [candidate division Zixibacteria bacterium]|nr:DMT family transporter [candidate division Zixibacteria bacterium]